MIEVDTGYSCIQRSSGYRGEYRIQLDTGSNGYMGVVDTRKRESR